MICGTGFLVATGCVASIRYMTLLGQYNVNECLENAMPAAFKTTTKGIFYSSQLITWVTSFWECSYSWSVSRHNEPSSSSFTLHPSLIACYPACVSSCCCFLCMFNVIWCKCKYSVNRFKVNKMELEIWIADAYFHLVSYIHLICMPGC